MIKVETVFKKFVSIYGAQKVAAMWAGADIDDVKGDWSRQLDRVSGAAIGRALQTLVDTGSEWPPTMGAFMAICKEPRIAAHQPVPAALPPPGQTYTDNETAKRKIAALIGALARSKTVA